MATFGGCACAPGLSRRGLLGAGLFACNAARAAAPDTPWRVDVHHHLSPPVWVDALRKAGLDAPPIADWTPQRSIEQMDRAGIATSVLSPTSPQVTFLPAAQAASVARASNEYAVRLRADHPGRFGVFAMLPLPYVDESLAEITYAMDVLKADGIGILTSYGDRWLGHPGFLPVFEELNRREATVYTHPTSANCCVNLVPGVADTSIEWGADTTRAITTLIFGGTAQRCPGVKFIFSHGGGVLTAVAERLQIQMISRPPYQGVFTRAMVDGELRRFFYDTAQVANAVTIDALAKLVPVSQIVFGSDYPYRTPIEHVDGLARHFDAADLMAIERTNAVRILPRLSG